MGQSQPQRSYKKGSYKKKKSVDRHFLFLPEVGIVKSVNFTRDSTCLARDELLVISKGDHISIFFFGGGGAEGGRCTVLYCTALAGVVN